MDLEVPPISILQTMAITSGSVSVFVGTPQPTPDTRLSIAVSSDWDRSQKTQLAHHRDSIQALQSAMILIAARLNNLNSALNGSLRWDGGRGKGDLEFL